MLKKLLPLLAVFSLLLSTSCVSPFFHPPTEQEGTIWECEEPQMYITVDQSIDMGNIGYAKDGFGIKLLFGDDFNTYILDYNEYMKTRENHTNRFDALIFSGDCSFGFTSFTITVTKTKTDDIKIGDVITFKRVDKVPDWAEEIETTTIKF